MNDEDYFDSQEFQELLEQYESSVSQGGVVYMDADDLADIADYYHYNGRYDEAHTAIDKAVAIHPDAVGPLLYKAREAISAGDFEKARDYSNRLEVQDHIENLYLRAEILINEEHYDEAEELLHDYYMKELMPDEHEDYIFDVANLYSDYGLYDRSLEWMSRSRGDDSDDFKELMARTLFGLGKYRDSERLFNELIDSNPFSKNYWNALASAQFMSEDYGASVTSSEFAIAIDPEDPESILSKANGLYRLDNFEEALRYFERYSEKCDYDEFGYLHQGTCLINLNRYDDAIVRLEKALEVSPPDSQYLCDIYQELAFAYNEQQMPETALYYIDQTDGLDCDHVDMKVIKGHILLSNQRLRDAGEVFNEALKESMNAPKTMLRIMVSLYDNRYVGSAYNMFKKFFNLVDDDFLEGYSYMALCCWDLQNYDEFLYYLKKALSVNKKEARMVLGHLFPSNVEPDDYLEYMINRLKR